MNICKMISCANFLNYEDEAVPDASSCSGPIIGRYPATADSVTCKSCLQLSLPMFNLSCSECVCILSYPSVTTSQLFTVMRQWAPAVQQKMEFLIQQVLSKGGHIDDYDGVCGNTLLHFAVRAGCPSMGGDFEVTERCVNFLLEEHANPFLRSLWTGLMPFHYAAYYNVPRVLQLLLDYDSVYGTSDVHYVCEEWENNSALHLSCLNLSYEAAECLLAAGASPFLLNASRKCAKDLIPEEDILNPDSEYSSQVRKMHRLLTAYTPKDDPNVPNYNDVHGKVILHAMRLQIGDKVRAYVEKEDLVGILSYSGVVAFSSGMWAGISLSKSIGKNDGTVAGVTYFSCLPKHGLFVPLAKVYPAHSAAVRGRHRLKICERSGSSSEAVSRSRRNSSSYGIPDLSTIGSKIDTGLRSGRSDSGSICSETGESLTGDYEVGDLVTVSGYKKGSVKYSGLTHLGPEPLQEQIPLTHYFLWIFLKEEVVQ